MSRHALAAAVCFALLSASPSGAVIDFGEVTADGTWDCKDQAGTPTGTVVLAETSYAFIKLDGTLAGYGKVYAITAGGTIDLPMFAMVSGYMKDELGSSGLGMRGPRDNPFDYTGELYLNVVLSEDGKQDWDCIQRKAPGA
jgi:hypothetical protein